MSAAEQAKADSSPAAVQEDNILEKVYAATEARTEDEKQEAQSLFKRFLQEIVEGHQVSKTVEKTIKYWKTQIDKKLSAQLNEIMHQPEFQKLEATWRGLHYLVHQSETGDTLKIRALNATKTELLNDLENAVEFDQSTFFKKVYEDEYGILGGTPYGMLVGDYEFSRHPQDIKLLDEISKVAAQAHAPFIAAADPKMLNLKSFADLPNPRELARQFDTPDAIPWKSFRDSEQARYTALTMPRVLARYPYGEDFRKVQEFNFEEAVDGKEHNNYLWMNAAWAYAARVTNAFALHGWFAATRGVENGGIVEGLPVHTFRTDEGDMAMKCPSEIAITERREYELSNLGYLPLVHYKNKDCAVFMGAQSCNKPKDYFDSNAKANAQLSSKINYLMCVSRFAHYLKVMARNWVGSFKEKDECERKLNEWIQNYVLATPELAGPDARAKRPLKEAKIEVTEVPGMPGHFQAKAYLKPHFQFEAIDVTMSLVARIPPKPGA